MKIELRRLLKRPELYTLIGELSNAPLLVRDAAGRVLFGEPEMPIGDPEPVLLEGEAIGSVAGVRAKAAAALLSHLAALEYEKKTLGQETLSKYREITLLYNIAEQLADGPDSLAVAQLILNEAMRLFRADGFSLMLLNEETGRLEVMAGLGGETDGRLGLRPGEGIGGSVAESGKAEIINDVAADPRYVPGHRKQSSMMSAPLKIKERVIGVINVSSSEPAEYTAEHLKLLSALTLQAAAAIENARLYDTLKETFMTTVFALAETIEKRDPYTGGHTRRVMNYSLAIGRVMGLPAAELERLRLAAVLHDVGKVGISDNVLLKPGRLTDEEFAEIKKHPRYGAEVLQYIKHFKEIVPGVLSHHERFDGRGYPEGLAGEEIDLIARIIAVADTYDAMTSDRPYRKGLDAAVAVAEIERCAGSQFDPVVVRAFLTATAAPSWGS